MSGMDESAVEAFLHSEVFGVAGASSDPNKFGFRCFRALLQSGRTVYPVNPRGGEILGVAAISSVSEAPRAINALSVVTPPAVTEHVVRDAIAAGVTILWMQPGAESSVAIAEALASGVTVIADGPCLLVELARH